MVLVLCEKSFYTLETFTYVSLLLHDVETVKAEYIYTAWKEIIISHKKRSIFYNDVCIHKLFNRHHSDRICFIHVCKKRMQNRMIKLGCRGVARQKSIKTRHCPRILTQLYSSCVI